MSFAWFFVLNPLANRAADDMAAFIGLTSKTWVSLPEQERIEFKKQMTTQHGLFFSNENVATQELKKFYPFVPRIEKALKKYTGQPITIRRGFEKETRFWFELNFGKEKVNIGFFHHRQGPRPPIALTGIGVAAAFLIIFMTLLLVRRITLPIKRLSKAANQFGQGQFSTRISETGPTELASLAHSFNHMAKEIAQLMENRAILFGGISHDLRTPITRMQVALELLEQDKDKALIASLKNDLNEMESLIKKSLARHPRYISF
jgi:two-component system osmolarity sensor histidine kinase EnvZ